MFICSWELYVPRICARRQSVEKVEIPLQITTSTSTVQVLYDHCTSNVRVMYRLVEFKADRGLRGMSFNRRGLMD